MWPQRYQSVTPYWPDLVIYSRNNALAMMELTYQLDSVENLQPAKEWKQGKKRIPSELHCVGVAYSYNTIKISMLGHYLAYTSSLNINIFFKKDLLAQHRLLSDDSYSYVYICIFIPSHTVYILFTTQSQKLVSPIYNYLWYAVLSTLLMGSLSPPEFFESGFMWCLLHQVLA